MLHGLDSLWAVANPDERKAIAAELFDAIYCDLDRREIKAVELKKALHPLWNALPKCTQSGSDGIRTRDLLRDRQAC